jgi:predicted transcriptional regulator of viral defense system
LPDVPPDDPEFKSETDRIIYEYTRTNGFITTAQVRQITGLTTSQGANAALGRLIKLGLLEKIRKGRQFIYQLTN